MSLSNNLGNSITVTVATKVQDIANALRTATTGTNTTVVIGVNTWRIAHGCVSGTADANSIYLTTGALCACTGTYTVRPMIKNLNWGGLNGSSCNQPTQTPTKTQTPTPTQTQTPTPTSAGGAVTFSRTFTNGQSPSTTIENAWTTFRSQLTGSYPNNNTHTNTNKNTNPNTNSN